MNDPDWHPMAQESMKNNSEASDNSGPPQTAPDLRLQWISPTGSVLEKAEKIPVPTRKVFNEDGSCTVY